eukprot:CAMPEP_0184503142 /NCGR_PEP_ID=MMETSP0113_2-20130426/51712_1 /TAXON_ID=91329 /ORGANISM="Norrisiella sphaerica, Strain BC52" /LENGTH=853 /DNA_ID=CAMNT_0026892585 /DNA_START=221 /DNA_END=2782 /DNA_ORIENTATION=-
MKFVDQARNAGWAATATAAAQAVSSAVAMKKLEAPDLDKTFIVVDDDDDRRGRVDESGLPLVYDKDLIEQFWAKERGALNKRWTEFLGYSVPFLTRIAGYLISGGTDELLKHDAELAKDAREIMEKLGPTYIKLGQTLSVRPDVLPQAAMEQLAILQDGVKVFPSDVALKVIEQELGQPIAAVFDEISEEPVAAASLAQVYRGRLRSNGQYVAIKVQRPDIRETVSKDLYVLRRAAEVYQGVFDRFVPQQRTDYVALLNEWAVGFYTELDFLNEAKNQMRLKKLLEDQDNKGVYIPEVYEDLCTRKLLISEWVEGVKLSKCEPEEIRDLIAVGQECFLTQLLQVGFFHGDPHPGNLLKLTDTSKGKIALLDFGLMARVQTSDIDKMVSSIIHLANKDYASLVDDFIGLGILPEDCDRAKVVPLMDKALSPYVKGGGAKKYEEELKKMYGMDGTARANVGGFQAMTQDALTVMNDIPFTIPPYFAILGKAVVTLEGLALTGNPDYGIIMEAYPFVARKLLKEDRPEVQRSLQQVLYGTGDGKLGAERLAVIINSALGVVARGNDANAFIDFDSIPEDAVGLDTALRFFLSNKTTSLRNLLVEEAVSVSDILLRQGVRKTMGTLSVNLRRPPLPFLPSLPVPDLNNLPIPVLLPSLTEAPAAFQDSEPITNKRGIDTSTSAATATTGSDWNPGIGRGSVGLKPVVVTPSKLLDTTLPKLSREEELYALSIKDLTTQVLGPDAASLINGDALSDPTSLARVLVAFLATPDMKSALRVIAPDLLGALDVSNSDADGTTSNTEYGNLSDAQKIIVDLNDEERTELTNFLQKVLSGVWVKLSERSKSITQSESTSAPVL